MRQEHSLGLQCSLASLTFHSEILGTRSMGVENAFICLSKVLMNKVVITKAYLMKSLVIEKNQDKSAWLHQTKGKVTEKDKIEDFHLSYHCLNAFCTSSILFLTF